MLRRHGGGGGWWWGGEGEEEVGGQCGGVWEYIGIGGEVIQGDARMCSLRGTRMKRGRAKNRGGQFMNIFRRGNAEKDVKKKGVETFLLCRARRKFLFFTFSLCERPTFARAFHRSIRRKLGVHAPEQPGAPPKWRAVMTV